MTSWVPPEVNNPQNPILVVGRDPGRREMELGRPFVGPAGGVLESALGSAGLPRTGVNLANVVGVQPPGNDFKAHRREDVERGRAELCALIATLRPAIVVALGNEVSFTVVPGWPSRTGDVFGATGILERRGFFWWNEELGVKVMTTLHPSFLLRGAGEVEGAGEGKGINVALAKVLFRYDLERAKEDSLVAELHRPLRKVTVVPHKRAYTALRAIAAIRRMPLVGCDIENYDDQTLACVGFAPSEDEAFVFMPDAFPLAFDLLRDPSVHLVFHNGMYDTYFLRTRCGVVVEGWTDDTIVAFHCCWPAFAGQGGTGGKRSKRTQKSLRFLASLYCRDPWYKDYDFASDAERYELNGMDCMITVTVMKALRGVMEELEIPQRIYTHEMRLARTVGLVLERGLRVDGKRREQQLAEVVARKESTTTEMQQLAHEVLVANRARLSRPRLFWKQRRCGCCKGGKVVRAACWRCAGFEKRPGKKALAGTILTPCAICSGAGKIESFKGFNPNSTDQVRMVLYEALGVAARYKDGKVSVEEGKLKEILAGLS